MADRAAIDPHLLVILGGTGDLARRKLLPALAEVVGGKQLWGRVSELGVWRGPLDDDA